MTRNGKPAQTSGRSEKIEISFSSATYFPFVVYEVADTDKESRVSAG